MWLPHSRKKLRKPSNRTISSNEASNLNLRLRSSRVIIIIKTVNQNERQGKKKKKKKKFIPRNRQESRIPLCIRRPFHRRSQVHEHGNWKDLREWRNGRKSACRWSVSLWEPQVGPTSMQRCPRLIVSAIPSPTRRRRGAHCGPSLVPISRGNRTPSGWWSPGNWIYSFVFILFIYIYLTVFFFISMFLYLFWLSQYLIY